MILVPQRFISFLLEVLYEAWEQLKSWNTIKAVPAPFLFVYSFSSFRFFNSFAWRTPDRAAGDICLYIK